MSCKPLGRGRWHMANVFERNQFDYPNRFASVCWTCSVGTERLVTPISVLRKSFLLLIQISRCSLPRVTLLFEGRCGVKCLAGSQSAQTPFFRCPTSSPQDDVYPGGARKNRQVVQMGNTISCSRMPVDSNIDTEYHLAA